ncbi:MAG TPA: hypothetical protein VJ810_02785 [Blastocatellia bacterium]|nr:hypothetical protein [Blastocatellia bacterium]
MNQRLTATGNRILRASRRLLQLPQPAPVPRAFAALLTDPAELLEKTWSAALSLPQAKPDFPGEPMPSAEFNSLNIPRRASLRRDKTPERRSQNLFEEAVNPDLHSSGLAAGNETFSPPFLPDATFWSATARRRFGGQFLKPDLSRTSAVLTNTTSAPLNRKNSFRDQAPQTSMKPLRYASDWRGERTTSEPPRFNSDSTDDPATEAAPQPWRSNSKDEPIVKATLEPPSHSNNSTRLTRSSSRLAAVLNANLRAQTEAPQSATSGSAPDSPPRERQPLNLVRGATSPKPIAESETDEQAFPELIHAQMEPSTGSATSAASLPTVESIWEELYERLRVEYLRAYGSSGG